MARYRQEYQRTQESVMEKASFLQRQGSWLVILSILLVALVAGVILLANSWDIGYSIREKNVERTAAEENVERTAAEDYQVMDSYLEQGDYGKFVGYYSANDIGIVYENPYQGLEMAAYAYVDLMRYVAALNDSSSFWYKPNRIGDTCEYIAEDLNRIYALEDRYSDDIDRYLPADKRVYYDGLCNRTAAIAKAYFGLTDKDIEDIPNLSKKKLAAMIEEGIAS